MIGFVFLRVANTGSLLSAKGECNAKQMDRKIDTPV
jgi:hypothetical protein